MNRDLSFAVYDTPVSSRFRNMSRVRWSIQSVVLAIAIILTFVEPVRAQNVVEEDPLPPIFTAADLNLDTSRLQPHRLVYDPSSGERGPESSIFSDGLFSNPRISITFERTLYYDAEGMPRDAIRVRWVSNTHPHTDEIVVDALTLTTINEQTRSGRSWETKSEILYVRSGSATVLDISDADAPARNSFALQHPHHFGLMVFPYLFASMDVPDGATFRLPAIGSDSETFTTIRVVGPGQYTAHDGSILTAREIVSVHSWGEISWFVSSQPPHHVQAIWRYGQGTGDLGSLTSVSKVIDWDVFPNETMSTGIDLEVHSARIDPSQ